MPTCVCLLRGVNLGARSKVNMKALQELFAGLGHENVQTYIQSGNVVFTARGRTSPARLAEAIEKQIAAEFDLDVRAVVRTAAELGRIVSGNPFLESGVDPDELHVTFLAEEPSRGRLSEVDPARFRPDEFRVKGREVYLHCPNGYGRSKLNNAFWEKQAGVAATTRNWRTVTKLLQLADPAAQAAPTRG